VLPSWVAGTRQALPAEPLGERLRVLWLGEAEYHEVEIIAVQRGCEWRNRKGIRKAADGFAIVEAAPLVDL